MKKFDYFKLTFIYVAAGLTVGMFVFGLLTNKIDNSPVATLGLKSLFVGTVTGLLLGVFNMYVEMLPFKKNDN